MTYKYEEEIRLFQKNNCPMMLSPYCQIQRISGQKAWIWQSKPSTLGQFNFWNSLTAQTLPLDRQPRRSSGSEWQIIVRRERLGRFRLGVVTAQASEASAG